MGVIKMGHLDDHALKLQRIFKKTAALIAEYKPDCVALEAPFYGKNIQVMLKLGRAQGVAMAAALNADIPIFEYAPRKIKQSVTGNGNASKEQVAGMLQSLLNLKEFPTKYLDASDGLAVAVCHHFNSGTIADTKTGLVWSKTLATDVTHESAEKMVSLLDGGWRLPKVDELFSLVDHTKHSPAIDTDFFPDVKSDWYWTSTPCAWNETAVWVVLFSFGFVLSLLRGSGYACVLAVRSSQ